MVEIWYILKWAEVNKLNIETCERKALLIHRPNFIQFYSAHINTGF